MGIMPMIMARAVMRTGAEAGEAGFGGGGDWVSVVQEAFLGEGDDEECCGGAHAHAHDRAPESWGR